MESAAGFWPPVVIIASFMTGSALLMWMGEQITEFGIGNGISVILFVSIVSRFPSQIGTMITSVISTPSKWWIFVLMLLGALAIIVLIVIVTNAERRIPVQYSKRVVGRKMYGGQSTHLPMKVNMSGVLPIIFAQSIASIPATIVVFVPSWEHSWVMDNVFNTSTLPYAGLYFLLILFFSYFYSTVQFNPIEIANNLKKNGGFIPGFRAGKPTSEFIQKVLTKITLFGALYLAIIAITPILISYFSETAANSGISLGGTSIIIVISVALETIKQLESQLLMRHYKGFLE
jgi:preprotein translocase subunit SecY